MTDIPKIQKEAMEKLKLKEHKEYVNTTKGLIRKLER